MKVLITSALPYANGPLHFGHIAGAYLPGDCYARFCRLIGDEVLYICGSDEYGVAITMSAELAGRTPQQQVDLFHNVNKDLFDKLNFSFDHYSRTTCKYHQAPAQQFFTELLENGYIEKRETEELYSEEDERFLADRYVVGRCPKCGFDQARGDECQKCGASYDAIDLKEPRSKMTGAKLIKKSTTHWFLLLDQFKERLQKWLSTKDWKPNVVNFIKGYINDLHPRAITRDSKWGVPVPLEGAKGKVLYVWFDAPIGYISASMEWAEQRGDPDAWKAYWQDENTKLVHFIGKDNIPFHASIFPAMIMGQNESYKLVDEVPANEFLNLEGRCFSKSDGWTIDLETFFETYTTDQIRYTLAANAPETQDAEFTWDDFQMRCNSELVGKFGNLVNRVMVFTHKQLDGKVPPQHSEDREFLDKMDALVGQAKEAFASYKLRRASKLMIELATLGNVYFDAKAPWKQDQQDKENTLYHCLKCLQTLALVATPIIPHAASKLTSMLGIQIDKWALPELQGGSFLGERVLLFDKVEDEQIEHDKNMLLNNLQKS